MIVTILGTVVACALLGGAGTSRASEFDRAMQPVLAEYLKIQRALASDKTEGVASSIEGIEKSAKGLDPEASAGAHSGHYASIPADLVAACGKLRKAKDLSETREAFKALSKPVAMWVGMAKPKGTSVMYCPMVESVWVQHGTEVSNPYYGSDMLGCGQKVGGAD